MSSIKTKIAALTLGVTLLSSIAIGSAGIISAGKVIDSDSSQIMNSYCIDRSQKINGMLQRIKQSVETVSDYAKDHLGDMQRFQTDDEYVAAYTNKMEDILLNAAKHTEGAVAAYIRYNADFRGPVAGLFYTLDSQEGEFERNTLTDLSQYEKNDIEHVGWYHIPMESGKPTWLPPYHNKNINVQMISYVIPVEVDGVQAGVVGMDIDFKVLKKLVDDTKIFKTGFAFLTDEQYDIVYHKDYVMYTPLTEIDSGLTSLAVSLQNHTNEGELVSYTLEGEEWKAAYQGLDNGMKIVLTAPAREINKSRTDLVAQIVLITLCICCVTFLVTILITGRMSKPLAELNIAAQKIADGDLSVTITHKSNDEIGTLAESFRKTASQLEKHISYIKKLAYRDSMTGVKSKTAYLEAVAKIEEDMQIGRPDMALVVFDINNLKQINDKFGHDMGDMQIIGACQVICQTFKHSPVYRIGGDEFAAILTGRDLKNYRYLLDKFQKGMEEYNNRMGPDLKIDMARGIAIYDPVADLSYADLFKRADAAMYKNKARLKGGVREENQMGDT